MMTISDEAVEAAAVAIEENGHEWHVRQYGERWTMQRKYFIPSSEPPADETIQVYESLELAQWAKRNLLIKAGLAAAMPLIYGDREAFRSIPVDTLKWWRQLIDINPQDLAARLDAAISRKG